MGVAIAGVLAMLHLGARADDDSDRAEIENRIDSKLGEIASDLAHVASASSSSDLEQAIRDGDDLKSEVERLDRVKGDDSRARDIVDHYPDYVRSLDDAARSIHHRGQRTPPAPERDGDPADEQASPHDRRRPRATAAMGNYLGPEAVAAAGGRARITEVVQPAAMAQVGPLLYVQLSASIGDALAPATEAKRAALAPMMIPDG